MVRDVIGPDAVVGLTTSTTTDVDVAMSLAPGTVDYLGIGAIRATATKADRPDVLGIEGFGELARRTPLPCVAIGGVITSDAAGVRTAGGAGLAVVSAICAADDARRAAAAFRAGWDQ